MSRSKLTSNSFSAQERMCPGGETQPDVGCIVECDWCRCTQDSHRFSLLMYTRVIAGAKRSVLWDIPVYQSKLRIFLVSLQKVSIFGLKTHLFWSCFWGNAQYFPLRLSNRWLSFLDFQPSSEKSLIPPVTKWLDFVSCWFFPSRVVHSWDWCLEHTD